MPRGKGESMSSRRIGAIGLATVSRKKIVLKPDHIVDLGRRQHAVEDEIAKALSDLNERMLHLKHELEKVSDKAAADKRHHNYRNMAKLTEG